MRRKILGFTDAGKQFQKEINYPHEVQNNASILLQQQDSSDCHTRRPDSWLW